MTETNTKSILIVEDEEAMAKAAQLKLSNFGYVVDTVGDGSQAIDVLKSKSYDLVLLDLMMPEVDGWTVLETLQKSGAHPKIVVSSNLSQDEDIAKAKALGATDFIVKSNVSLAELADRVKEILAQ